MTMRKKVVSVFIVLCMIASVMPTAFAEKITMSEFTNRLNSIQSKYKAGTSVSQIYNSTYQGSSCYKDLSGWSSWQCMAWAYYVFDTVWKVSVRNDRTDLHSDVSRLFVGDYVRYRSTESLDHSIFITKISGNDIYYTDGNGQGTNLIRYNVHTTKSELQALINKKLKDEAGKGYIRHSWDNGLNNDPLGKPVYVGEDFYSYIVKADVWKMVTYDKSWNVYLDTDRKTTNQVWHFKHLGNNLYKIENLYDGKALEVQFESKDKGANIGAQDYWGGTSQQWYIYGELGQYVLRAKNTQYVMDVSDNNNSDGTNIATWESNNTSAQKFHLAWADMKAPILSVKVGNSNSETKLVWEGGTYANGHDIKIWRGTYWVGEAYHNEWNVTDTPYSIRLPAGHYEAYVDAKTAVEKRMSNVVAFDVAPAPEITPALTETSHLYKINTEISNLSENAVCVAGLYSDSGILLETDSAELSSGGSLAALAVSKHSNAAYIRVFLWDSLNNIAPLAESKKIDL